MTMAAPSSAPPRRRPSCPVALTLTSASPCRVEPGVGPDAVDGAPSPAPSPRSWASSARRSASSPGPIRSPRPLPPPSASWSRRCRSPAASMATAPSPPTPSQPPVGEIARASSSTSSTSSATSAAAEKAQKPAMSTALAKAPCHRARSPAFAAASPVNTTPGRSTPGARPKMERLRIGSGPRGDAMTPTRAARSASCTASAGSSSPLGPSATAAAWAGRPCSTNSSSTPGSSASRPRSRTRRAALRASMPSSLQRSRQRPASPLAANPCIAAKRPMARRGVPSSSSWSTQPHGVGQPRHPWRVALPPRSTRAVPRCAASSRVPPRARSRSRGERPSAAASWSSAAAPLSTPRSTTIDRTPAARSAAPSPPRPTKLGAPAPSTEAMFAKGRPASAAGPTTSAAPPCSSASRVRALRLAVRAVPRRARTPSVPMTRCTGSLARPTITSPSSSPARPKAKSPPH